MMRASFDDSWPTRWIRDSAQYWAGITARGAEISIFGFFPLRLQGVMYYVVFTQFWLFKVGMITTRVSFHFSSITPRLAAR